MRHRLFPRLTAAALSLSLLLLPAAQALTVEQAGELLDTYYVDTVPRSVLEQPTVDAMLEALGDPYTEYFTPEEYQAFTDSMSDTSLVGIGIVFTLTEEGLLLDQVLEGSAALEAGMAPGDLIVAVDGNSVLGEDSTVVTGWIQGEEGTTLKVTYLRDGKKKTVTLTRRLVVVPATTSELLDGHIGYIRCTTFGSETVGHFREALEAYGDQANMWIVDLRSNLGGATTAATESAGLFTGPGEMAYLRDGEDYYSAYYQQDASLTLYPAIVLVDEYSASSSEIFASAIRDRGAGIVVGTRTFGKGVAQSVLDRENTPEYFPDGDALKITSHRFFSPAGNTTDQVGVIPDFLVEPEQIADVAYLLSHADPSTDKGPVLRIDQGWRLYVDLEAAATAAYKDAFTALLNAIPDSVSLWIGGEAGSEGWARTTASYVAQLCAVTYTAPFFSDQDASAFYTPLSILKTYGLVNGKDDGAFHPQDTLTRAELCQLLAVALNCTVPANASPFTDVAADAWYAPAVTAMSNMGLVAGTGDGTFRPEDPIDHQQFITILGRLAQWVNLYLYNTAQAMPEGSTNAPGLLAYADWAKPAAWLMSYSQTGFFGNTISLLWDTADSIDPTAATTRDEAACALYRLLSHTDLLPA